MLPNASAPPTKDRIWSIVAFSVVPLCTTGTRSALASALAAASPLIFLSFGPSTLTTQDHAKTVTRYALDAGAVANVIVTVFVVVFWTSTNTSSNVVAS